MITVFPVCSLSTFALIILLFCSPSYQLHRIGDNISVSHIGVQQVDVVRGDHVVQKEHQIKVGCCGFAAAQKKCFELFNNTMKADALRFVNALGMR